MKRVGGRSAEPGASEAPRSMDEMLQLLPGCHALLQELELLLAMAPERVRLEALAVALHRELQRQWAVASPEWDAAAIRIEDGGAC